MIGRHMKYLLAILVLLGCLSADAGAADFNGIDLSTMCVSNNQAIRDQCTAWSKYPPAEPGALRFEPLKAAVAASHVTLIGLIASPQHWKQPVLAPSRALTNRTSFAPCFASAACVHLPIKARERSRCTRSRSGRPTPGNVKLLTATPAEPGELPLH
jgi:hypothetical protein